MPIFDLRCTSCQKRKRDVVLSPTQDIPACGKCGGVQEKVWDKPPAMYEFKAGYYEHIDVNPIYIGSKRQLREECEKRGQYSEYSRD